MTCVHWEIDVPASSDRFVWWCGIPSQCSSHNALLEMCVWLAVQRGLAVTHLT